eukprot:gene15552-21645_t
MGACRDLLVDIPTTSMSRLLTTLSAMAFGKQWDVNNDDVLEVICDRCVEELDSLDAPALLEMVMGLQMLDFCPSRHFIEAHMAAAAQYSEVYNHEEANSLKQ